MSPQEFKEARQKLGLSLSELGLILRTDPRTIRKWEADPGNATTARSPNPIACQVLRWLESGALKLDVSPEETQLSRLIQGYDREANGSPRRLPKRA